MPIADNLIDQLLEGCSSPEDILGESAKTVRPLHRSIKLEGPAIVEL